MYRVSYIFETTRQSSPSFGDELVEASSPEEAVDIFKQCMFEQTDHEEWNVKINENDIYLKSDSEEQSLRNFSAEEV